MLVLTAEKADNSAIRDEHSVCLYMEQDEALFRLTSHFLPPNPNSKRRCEEDSK